MCTDDVNRWVLDRAKKAGFLFCWYSNVFIPLHPFIIAPFERMSFFFLSLPLSRIHGLSNDSSVKMK